MKDRKLLVTRSKGKMFFIAPGGKIEAGENAKIALIRELEEELRIKVEMDNLKAFGTFFAQAAEDKDMYLQMATFIVIRWNGELMPSNEIEEIKWINSSLTSDIELGSIFRYEVLPRLKERNLID